MDPTTPDSRSSRLMLRGAVGGTLMGLANLVPGISGGTMLLASGVYPAFIAGIAEITTLHFRVRSLQLLASVGAAAALVILLLAGSVRDLVRDERMAMYSLFIGLTLGGVPLVWRMARPATPSLIVGALVAFAAMVAMALGSAEGAVHAGPNAPLLVVSGLAASSAMILPGVSGGYLLLLLGQYETILGAVDQLKQGLIGASGPDFALVFEALRVAVPLGIGIAIGIIGVSNLLKWLLDRFEKPTLGALLGLLFGAVVGLWPFQETRPPVPGDVIGDRVVVAETVAEIERDAWPVARFEPDARQAGTALALIAFGFAGTLAIGRLGGGDLVVSAQSGDPEES